MSKTVIEVARGGMERISDRVQVHPKDRLMMVTASDHAALCRKLIEVAEWAKYIKDNARYTTDHVLCAERVQEILNGQ